MALKSLFKNKGSRLSINERIQEIDAAMLAHGKFDIEGARRRLAADIEDAKLKNETSYKEGEKVAVIHGDHVPMAGDVYWEIGRVVTRSGTFIKSLFPH